MKLSLGSKLNSLVTVFLFVFLTLSFTAIGCGGGEDEDGDVDGDDVTDGDADVADGDDTEDDVDGDKEDECTCTTDDACCDGCKPINEGGECNDDDGCTQTDTCKMGVCEGSNPVVCEAVDQCHDAGECDSATGKCSEPVKADDTACDDEDGCTQTDTCQQGVCTGSNPVICEALDECHEVGECDSETGNCSNPMSENGTLCTGWGEHFGSGVCLDGECNGLSQCVLRDWAQPLAYPCNSNSDCESGICAKFAYDDKYAQSGYSFCTKACDMYADDCPAGMDCVSDISFNPDSPVICIPEDDTLPNDGSKGLYEACNYDEDCESGYCMSYNGYQFCSAECYDSVKIATTDNCGECGVCEDELWVKGESKTVPFCVPDNVQEMGALCVEDSDCGEWSVCHQNRCLQVCGIKKEATCPDDYSCRMTDKIIAGTYGYLCVPDEEIGAVKENGDCKQQYDCEDGTYCDTYPNSPLYMVVYGLDYGGFLLDFDGALHPDKKDPIQITIPIDGEYAFYFANYFQTYSESVYYSISVANSTAVSPETIMEVEPNDKPGVQMQALTLPLILNGFLNVGDVDSFSFEAKKGDVITFTFLQREGTGKCLQQSKTGDDCSENIQCEGNICHKSKCTKFCGGLFKVDLSCPAGYECASDEDIPINYPEFVGIKSGASGYPICRLEEEVYKSYGETCETGYECDSGYCLLGRCTDECSGTKVIDCGEGDMVCRESSELMNSSVGKASIYMCLDVNKLNMDFGEACEYDLQCTSGLCYEGFCNIPYCTPPVVKSKETIECPSGYSCIDVISFSSMPLKTEEDGSKAAGAYTCIANDALGNEFGDECSFDYECASDYCLDGACNIECGVAKVDCPTGTKCIEVFERIGCYDESLATKGFGEDCLWDNDCESLSCYKGKCNLQCDIVIKAVTCPDSYSCTLVRDPEVDSSRIANTMPVCLPDSSINKAFGETCSEDHECTSGICNLDYCSEYCDPVKATGCAEGYSCQLRYLASAGDLKGSDYICKPE